MSIHHNSKIEEVVVVVVETDECDLTMCNVEGEDYGKCKLCASGLKKNAAGTCGNIPMCEACWSARIGDNICTTDGCERRILDGVIICTICDKM